VKVPQTKLLRVDGVKEAAHNPASRVRPGALKALVRSMGEVGLIYPILVDQGHTVIDGHRRLAAARELGWDSVAAIVVEADADRIYASVNETARKMSGAESLAVWLANGNAVGPRAAKTFAEMRQALGADLVREACERGLSSRVWSTALRVGRYCALQDRVSLRRVFAWLMRTAVIGQVMKSMEAGVEPETIAAAVRKDEPLRFFEVARAPEAAANQGG
jgi:hypothetical protein